MINRDAIAFAKKAKSTSELLLKIHFIGRESVLDLAFSTDVELNSALHNLFGTSAVTG